MSINVSNEQYFQHLKSISFLGRLYKKIFSSLLLCLISQKIGKRIVEVGSGIGSGILGVFPSGVVGLDINPLAVNFCVQKGMNAKLINEDGNFPLRDGEYDVCVLDNVLEHIENPIKTLDECYRITQAGGGLVVVVPGILGYNSDSDHKVFYDEAKLMKLDRRFTLEKIFALPSIFKSKKLSIYSKQYCLVAIYKKTL